MGGERERERTAQGSSHHSDKKNPNSNGSSKYTSVVLGFHPLIQISILDKAAQELLDL